MTYTLTGRYPTGDLVGQVGRLKFTPSTTIIGDDNIILPAPVEVELDSDGAFSVALVGTDDTDYSPSGWVWTVTELLPGGRVPWSFELTADSDLSDLATVSTPTAPNLYVPITRTLTAGDGLTGGGTLAANRTFAVGAGTGIIVNADTVSVVYGLTAGTAAEGDDLAAETAARVAGDTAARAAAEATAAAALAQHEADTTAVHGIANTANLETIGHAAKHASGGSDPVTLAQSQVTSLTADLALKAPLASPTFTGTVTIPTPATGSETTVAASTAFAAERARVGNLLTANQASIETDTTGWAATTNCTIARSTSWAAFGSASLELTSSAAGDMAAGTPSSTGGIPVAPGLVYNATATVRSAASARSVRLMIDWYTAAGASVSTVTGSSFTSSTSADVVIDAQGVAPATAAFARIRPYVLATGAGSEVHRFDKIGIWAGAGGDWAMPGTPITNLGTKVSHPNTDDVLVQRWDSSKATPGWQTIHYDSGFRNITPSPPTGWTSIVLVSIRRTLNEVEVRFQGVADTTGLGTLVALPAGFRPVDGQGSAIGAVANATTGAPVAAICYAAQAANTISVYRLAATTLFGSIRFGTTSALPTSLPGTLITAAPA